MIKTAEWILCPVCGSKTRDRLREDTVLKNYPLYCPKCKTGDFDKCKGTTYNRHQRARRTDAEPMNLRDTSKLIGSFILTIKFHHNFLECDLCLLFPHQLNQSFSLHLPNV